MDTCEDAMSVCELVDSAVPSGPISCEPSNQSAGSNYCYVSSVCSQYADINGIDVGLKGYVTASCGLTDDLWTCECVSGNDSETIESDADTGWAACNEMITACPEVVDVAIGQGPSYGGPIYLGASEESGTGGASGL
jgi:hypothetical protein